MDSLRPKVSVIIPAHNAAVFIRSTLESVFSQTYESFEVLVVDDGSTDETASLVQSFGQRVRYIHQPNAGPSAARNRGILSSAGEIVAFLDADDAWLPDLMALQVDVLNMRPEIDAVYAWEQFVDQRGEPLPDTLCSRVEGITLRRILVGGNPVQFSALAVRKSVFDRIGLFDPTLRQSEDWDVVLRMVIAGVRFACIPKLLVRRRVHPDSLTSDPGDALRWARLARDKAFSTLPLPPECRALAPMATFRIVHRAAMGYWRRGSRDSAAERFVEAFEAWPAALRQPQTYLGIISRLLPSGYRSEGDVLRNLSQLADEATRLLRAVFRYPNLPTAVQNDRRAAWSAFHAALTFLFAKKRDWLTACTHAVHAVLISPLTPLRGAAAFASRAAGGIGRGQKERWQQ